MGYVKKVGAAHYCRPPDPYGEGDDWEVPEQSPGGWPRAPRLKPGRRLPHVGDVWECERCGRWWELHPSRYDNVLTPEWHKKWRPWWKR